MQINISLWRENVFSKLCEKKELWILEKMMHFYTQEGGCCVKFKCNLCLNNSSFWKIIYPPNIFDILVKICVNNFCFSSSVDYAQTWRIPLWLFTWYGSPWHYSKGSVCVLCDMCHLFSGKYSSLLYFPKSYLGKYFLLLRNTISKYIHFL